MIKLIVIIMLFILGLNFIANYTHKDFMETFVNEKADEQKNCNDVLIQNGTKIYLFNSKLAPVPGINPIVFNNLDEYTEYIEWERANGRNCPILFLQKGFDAQNNSTYSTRPSPYDLQGGAENISSDNLPGNLSKKLQKMNDVLENVTDDENLSNLSTNPMDSNWGGAKFSQKLVEEQTLQRKEMDNRFNTIYQ